MSGASGQVDINPGLEVEEPMAMAVGEYDDRPNIPSIGQQHGPNSPAHGAAGGSDINFWTKGASPSVPEGPVGPQTGLDNPAFGG